MNEFEQKLQRQPMKTVPPEWRAEILAAARAAQAVQPAATVESRSFVSTLNRQLAALLWPHPVAWAGLAAIWIFIATLNFSLRDQAPRLADKAIPPSPEVMAELKKQQRMFAELLDTTAMADADRQKFFHKPRSEWREILTA